MEQQLAHDGTVGSTEEEAGSVDPEQEQPSAGPSKEQGAGQPRPRARRQRPALRFLRQDRSAPATALNAPTRSGGG